MTRWLSALLCLMACSGFEPVKPQINEHQITHSLIYSTYREWQNSGFYRLSLDHTRIAPIFVLVDRLGYACVVPDEVWALNPLYASCGTRWRAPR